jgi:hypothetical protein
VGDKWHTTSSTLQAPRSGVWACTGVPSSSSPGPCRSRQAASGALTGAYAAEFGGWCCTQFYQPHSQASRRAGCKVISGPLTAKHHAPRQPSHLFLLFFNTHFLPPSSKHCLLLFFGLPKTLHHFCSCPHLRVGQEKEDASQESRQGREGPSRPAGQQPQERHRE